jgi:hypothetical protein
MSCVRKHGANDGEKPEGSGTQYGSPRPPTRALRRPGKSYSDVILRLAAVGHESPNGS